MMPSRDPRLVLRNWFAAQWNTSAAGWIGLAAAVAVVGTVLVARTPVREEHKATPAPVVVAVPEPVVVPPPPPPAPPVVTGPVTTEFHPPKKAVKHTKQAKKAPSKAVAKPAEPPKVAPKKRVRPNVPVAERRKLAQCSKVPSMAYDYPVEKVVEYASGMTPALGPKTLRTLRWCVGG